MLVLLAAVIGAGGYFYKKFEQPSSGAVGAKSNAGGSAKGPRRELGPVPVVTAGVVRQDLPVVYSSIGRAEAPQTVALRSRVDGVIQAVRFTPGQPVRKGDLLVELDSRQIQAQLNQAKGNLARDQANLVKTRADLARYTDLAARKFVAASAVDAYKAAVQAAEATVDFDRAGVEYAQVQLEHTKIRAPMDGVIGALQVFPGSNVKANDTLIVTVNQLRPIYVNFSVPQAQLPGLRELAAKGPVEISAVAKDSDQQSRSGKLIFIDNAIDASTGTITIKAQFDNADLGWTPGQFVNVSLVSKVISDALTAPVEAVQMGPSGNFVFVVSEGKAQMRPIKSFVIAGNHVVLGDEFRPGEKLVIDGQMRLTPGAAVRERQSAASSPQLGPGGKSVKPALGAEGKSRSSQRADGARTGKDPG